MIALLVPVLGRPGAALPLVESWEAAGGRRSDIIFACSPNDDAQQRACSATGARRYVSPHPAPYAGDYAFKINHAAVLAVGLGYEWMLLGGDDLAFHPGWAEAALAAHAATDACVIGTNDLGNPTVKRGDHSTHPLVHRDYLTICGGVIDAPPGVLLYEGYTHNWVDAEFVGTARSRGTFAFARDAHVEHLHHFWGKGDDDDTYRLGRASYADDARLYNQRKGLWHG